MKCQAIFVILISLMLSHFDVNAQDVFETRKAIPLSPSRPLILSPSNYGLLNPNQPLTLQAAIERALENNSKTKQEWANIKIQAAALGIAYSSFLPTISGSVEGNREVATTDVHGHPLLNSDQWANTNTELITLSWKLIDFGARNAALTNSKQLYLAARANLDAKLREVFATVTKDYYSAQAAVSQVATAKENVNTAHDSFFVAHKRVENGVSPISDELQAHTALIQAQVDLTKATRDYRISIGTLAVDMGLRPDTSFILPSIDEGIKPDEISPNSISKLINEAVDLHPLVQSATAQLRAAEAKVRQIRAEGYPALSLTAQSSRADRPLNAEVGVSAFKATETDSYIGAKVEIPLFDGFSRDYQIRQAQAQVEFQNGALEEARQKVGLDVWSSFQILQEATQNISNTSNLVKTAQLSSTASQRRYVDGVGTMIERLNAQTALANAKLEWIKSVTDWRSSRYDLASKLGHLNLDSILRQK